MLFSKLYKWRNLFSRLIILILLCLLCLSFIPDVEASSVTIYPTSYSYVKPAPYWPCGHFDELTTSQQVTVINQDIGFLYVEYSKDGQLRRGYIGTGHFNASDYSMAPWPLYTHFTPGYNNSGISQNTYYGPNSNYARCGSIDADEGINANKPIFVLGYEGSRAFIQYITNPGESGHVLYKRAWVDSTCITLSPPTETFGNGETVLIKNKANGKYLEISENDTLVQGEATGDFNQQWTLLRYYSPNTGYYYKIYNSLHNKVFEVEHKTAVVGNSLVVSTPGDPNKAQEFSIDILNEPIIGDFNNYECKFFSRCSGYYLTIHGGDTFTQEKPIDSQYQIWVFEPLDRFYQEYYTEMSSTNGITTLPYFIDTGSATGINNAGITANMVQQAITAWNDLNAEVSLNRTYLKGSSKIRIIAEMNDVENYMGQTRYYKEDGIGDWTHTVVSINTSTIPISENQTGKVENFTDNQKHKLLCHEIGHTLGLIHPYGEGTNGLVVKSVMCQGLYGTNNKIRKEPSDYDCYTLRHKWGES